MTVRQTVRASLQLLTTRDRQRLGLVTLAQMSTALFDLLGVLLLGVVTALSVSTISDVPPPAPVQSLIEALGLDQFDTIALAIGLASIAGVLLISKSFVNVILTRRVLRFLANRQAVISGRLAAGLLSQPLLQLQQRSSQEIVYALTSGVSFATLNVLGQGVIAASELTLLIILALGLFVVSPTVTVFAVIYFLCIAWILQRVLSGRARRLGLMASISEVGSYEAIQEALRSYREAVVSHRRGLYVRNFQDLRWQAAAVASNIQFINLFPKYVFEIALIIGAGLLAASQLYTSDLTAALAVIAIFLAAGSRIVPSMLRLQGATILVRNASGQARPTYELASQLSLVKDADALSATLGPTDPESLKESLERGHPDFRPLISVINASLTYPGGDTPALNHVSLTLREGSSLALVGPTGAGKSTLADVILGILDVDEGEVLLGGIPPIEAVSRWPGAIAYVPQEVVLTNGTVRDNVAFALPHEVVDDDLVWSALRQAHLADFLQGSRDGLDTVVGEHGIRLSGGQRQRLGVARALYTRPKLLVLDEATSALDAETERAISSTLQLLEGSVSTVTIAHRLATIRHCDQIVYLEGGTVVAAGTFEEVRKATPRFDRQAKLLGL